MKKILVLGAGRVARPCVQHLIDCPGIDVAVADISGENVNNTIAGRSGCRAIVTDIGKNLPDVMNSETPDVVICLLPPGMMAPVASECLRTSSSLVHPAYLDENQKRLSDEFRKAGLVFIAELGLDPGIDHMSAAGTIRRIREQGGEIESFRSICGALPSAEANTNPWGYKLSWAPASLVGASRRDARVMLDCAIHEWPAGETFEHPYLEEIEGLGWFEVYANADSLPYVETYGIPETRAIYRGTIRYPGWCETICRMNEIGLFSENFLELEGHTFRSFMAMMAGRPGEENVEKLVALKLGLKSGSTVMLRFQWLGLFDDGPLPFGNGSARDVVSFLFGTKLVYAPEERDLVILRDEYMASFPKTGERRRFVSTLVDYGVPKGDFSVARTTGLPPAIAAKLVAEGAISTPGLHIPVTPEIYEPVLKELETLGIRLEETEETM